MRSFRSSRVSTLFSDTPKRTLAYPAYRNRFVHHPMYSAQKSKMDQLEKKLDLLRDDRRRVAAKGIELDAEIHKMMEKIDNLRKPVIEWKNKLAGKSENETALMLKNLAPPMVEDAMQAAVDCKNVAAIKMIAESNDCHLQDHLVHAIFTCNEPSTLALMSIIGPKSLNVGGCDWDGFPAAIPVLSIATEAYLFLSRDTSKNHDHELKVLKRLMQAMIRNGGSIYYNYGDGHFSVSEMAMESPALRTYLVAVEKIIRAEETTVNEAKALYRHA